MAAFFNLDDSPMFRKQIHSLEETTDVLKDRSQKLHQGCKRFMTSLGEAYNGDISFADALEAFGAGQDDPISVAIGGPVMSKFITAFRELATYKELLRTQVEHMLSDRLMQFISEDLQNVKECRKRFDKATTGYDQARDKFMSIKKGTRADIVTKLEEDLHNSKSTFDRCRFNLVNALATIEAKKKFEFLESISAVMDAHLRYYKQGHELLSQMEPFIHEVLTYAQQSKEMANAEQDKLATRIQEFRTQAQLSNLKSSSEVDAANNGDGIHVVGVNSYKSIEALMQSTAGGEVQVIKQGYLLKRSPKARGDWRRRFFVLDSHGTLYYYRSTWNKQPQGPLAQNLTGTSGGAGGFGRFRFSQKRASSQGDDNLWFRTVNLLTSTIKMDEEQSDLRFCFRVISPVKTLTLQAENEIERMEWVDKITGVIASLLNSPFPKQLSSGDMHVENDTSSNLSGSDPLAMEESTSAAGYGNVSVILRKVPGNDICAECGSPEPEWASLNLGILVCIECSGVHRNLGVHISKVRSLTLDVKVWEPSVVDLLCALGNNYSNSVWEGLLPHQADSIDDSKPDQSSIEKPGPKDSLSRKEKYIYAKYVSKSLVVREASQDLPPVAVRIWEGVGANDVRLVYHLLVASDANCNTRYDDVSSELHHEETTSERKQLDPAICLRIGVSGQPESCLQGCSLLHFGCHIGDLIMLELLLHFGADINLQDFHGRTPLHHCIFMKNFSLAKFLIRRGARTSIKDGGGLTALERTMELGAITDEELLVLLVEHQ